MTRNRTRAEISAELKRLYAKVKNLDDRRGGDGRTSIDPAQAIALIEIRNLVPDILREMDDMQAVGRLDYDQSGGAA